MLRAQIPEAHPFVLSLFGCQYHAESPSPTKAELITTFTNLLKASSSVAHIESLEQHGALSSPGTSRVWMTYWRTPADFQQWWSSGPVSSFWAALPDDSAGFWRETLQLSHRRSMFETNKPVANGLAHVGQLAPLTEKTGYWGAYRDRLADATPQERLASTMKSGVPPPKPAGGAVRRGRVLMKDFPDNMCLVVEGQDYSAMGPAEREHWRENFDGLTRKWVSHVVNSGPEAGMVSARLCHAPESGVVDGEGVDEEAGSEWSPAFGFNRKVQILYFADLSYMERIGKSVKTHVDLRKNFMKSYGPGGAMQVHDLLLWVELSVVKARDVEAEYVGCCDGTGFMAYDYDPAFQDQQGQSSWWPWSLVTRASQYVFGTSA
ncbi:uncharacterized protein LTHEOB_664 [Lasiodiplodia theobromae]|uniref:uncharacterized protein n=1 Tax=Lasiodiplodia theobromae TaxID=45133 RepID=UPI0015C3CAF0|nr:uncharacterized protein LTHEOB_664 [Lasiodiplodia theobromae]KAF4540722.1 hypothetical protein LTHEOB_664 [Lasiodiplodia theobromae]